MAENVHEIIRRLFGSFLEAHNLKGEYEYSPDDMSYEFWVSTKFWTVNKDDIKSVHFGINKDFIMSVDESAVTATFEEYAIRGGIDGILR